MDSPSFDSKFNKDLAFFKNLPANTDVHVGEHNYFVTNGGSSSCYMGVQTAVNYWKSYTPVAMAEEIDTFARKIIAELDGMFQNRPQTNEASEKQQSAYKCIHSACESVLEAIQGPCLNGGLQGLLVTHAVGPAHDKMQTAITDLKGRAEAYEKFSRARIKN